MRISPGFVAVAVLAVSIGFAPAARGAASDDDVKSVADSCNAFAFDLYAKLAKDHPGNLFFSPYSISSALAMTYAGARGETAEQMRKVLHFSLPDDRLHAAFAALSAQLDKSGMDGHRRAFQFVVANALWGQSGYPYNPAFIQVLQQNYGADLHQADFLSAPERARLDINQWVNGETQGKITELVPPGAVNAQTRLALLNAIYFKGYWFSPFDRSRTTEADFKLSDQRSVRVPMMSQGDIPAMENDELQAIDLAYAGYFDMVVLLPREANGLVAIEAGLTNKSLAQYSKQFDAYRAMVYLPRFRMESAFELTDALGSMGMSDSFGSAADFSGMTAAERLYISHVIHKAVVGVDEEGTEASASTYGGSSAASGSPHLSMMFRADHPFLVIIRERSSGTIIFMGRMVNPEELVH